MSFVSFIARSPLQTLLAVKNPISVHHIGSSSYIPCTYHGWRVKRMEERKKRRNEDELANLTQEDLSMDVFHFRNGLRCVKPYHYNFKVNAKQRWFGRTILDMLCVEFGTYPKEYYCKKIRLGEIRINDSIVPENTIIKNGDVLYHKVHRHEPPVTGQPIEIIHSTHDYIVINKPASIPVHPCGSYRFNSLLFILAKEYNMNNLHTVHRLDRLTSGIMVFAKTREAAIYFSNLINHVQTTPADNLDDLPIVKSYVAKVEGRFPNHVVDVREPIEVLPPKLGTSFVPENKHEGKMCHTVFQMMSYNASTDTSIVCCTPVTGRTHQIRVHLSWLGHPIGNDTIYNPKLNKNKKLPKYARRHDDPTFATIVPDVELSEEELVSVLEVEEKDPDCPICKNGGRLDPVESELFLWLHAYSLETKEWKYHTPLPSWAQ